MRLAGNSSSPPATGLISWERQGWRYPPLSCSSHPRTKPDAGTHFGRCLLSPSQTLIMATAEHGHSSTLAPSSPRASYYSLKPSVPCGVGTLPQHTSLELSFPARSTHEKLPAALAALVWGYQSPSSFRVQYIALAASRSWKA